MSETTKTERPHLPSCTGLRTVTYLTAVDGETVRVLHGTACCDCAAGRRLEGTGAEGIERALQRVARRRGPGWMTWGELAEKHLGVPLWSVAS